MATGNHFWLDCVAGIFVAILALAVVYKRAAVRLAARRRNRPLDANACRHDGAGTVPP